MQSRFSPFWAVALLWGLFALPASAQTPRPRGMATFRADARHSGHYQSAAYNHFAGVSWQFKTGGKVFSSPAVHNGVVYFGSEDKYLYALDAQSGKERWKFATGGAVHASPTVLDGTVYFTSFDGYCYAVDARTGDEKWRFATGGERRLGGVGFWGMTPVDKYHDDIWDILVSSPVVDPDLDGGVLYFGSGDGHVYALNLATGQLKWKFKTNDVVHSSPALAYGMVYVGSFDTYLYALDARTGAVKWQFKTDHLYDAMRGIQPSPLVYDGKVYFGSRDAHFYALDAFTGTLAWKYFADWAWIIGSAVADKGTVYVGTSDSNGFIAFDARTGAVQYTFDTHTYAYSSPAIAGGTAYFGNFTGTLFALDLQSEGKRWEEFRLEASKANSHKVVNDQGHIDWPNVILPGKDMMDYANNVWGINQIYTTGSIVSSPVVQDGKVYFGSADGSLYALSLGRNKAPAVALQTPRNGDTFAAGTTLSLKAAARDNPGEVRGVAFYANGQKIGETAAAPYQFDWKDVPTGEYSLWAKATDAEGGIGTSEKVTVRVGAGGTPETTAARTVPFTSAPVGTALAIGAFPNPFGETLTLEVTLPEAGRALVTLEGLLGKKTVLLDEYREPGTHRVFYNGHGLGRGIYVCRVSCNGKTVARKVLRK